MKKSIPIQRWLELSLQTRLKLIEEFNIRTSENTEVMNGKVVSDGRTQLDLDNSLTVETLQKYVNSEETDIFDLFQKVVNKIENKEVPTNFMQLKKYAKEKGIDISIYKTKIQILDQLNKI